MIIKERSKAARQERGPTVALYELHEDLGEQNNLIASNTLKSSARLKEQMEVFPKLLHGNMRRAGVANQP